MSNAYIKSIIICFGCHILVESGAKYVSQRVTTCPDTGQVERTPGVSCNMHDWRLGLF